MQPFHKNAGVTSTTYELMALQSSYCNLADAHPAYWPVASQQRIMDDLSLHYAAASQTPYQELSDAFVEHFFTLAEQTTALHLKRSFMLCYSASLCAQIIASYLRSKSMRVALLEPVFDSISGILQAEKVALVPIAEHQLAEIDTYLETTPVDALWITLPNNPTGFMLSEQAFHQLVDACCRHKVLLVVDFCFRFFAEDMHWDQYAVLERSGIQYAVIEDTGKTWSTLDLKVGMVQSSSDIHEDLSYYHNNHMLSVSRFVLQVLIKLMQDTQKRGLDSTVRLIPRINHEMVKEQLADTCLHYQTSHVPITVSWLKINDKTMKAQELWQRCKEVGVYVLPGTNFFWHHASLGDTFVRLSLARDHEVVRVSMQRLRALLSGRVAEEERS